MSGERRPPSGSGSGRSTGRRGTGRIFDEERAGSWLEAITVSGRFAILASIGFGALGFVLSFEWMQNNWEGSYPLGVAMVPGLIGAASAYALARTVLRVAGIPFYVQDVG